jgi:hypothetical protein
MMLLVTVLAVLSVVTLLVGGYLFGARAGRAARAAILEEREAQVARVHELEARLAVAPPPAVDRVKLELQGMLAPLIANVSASASATAKKDPSVDVLRHEMQSLADSVAARERSIDSFRVEIRSLLSTVGKAQDPDQVHRDLQKVTSLLSQRGDGTSDVRKMMTEVLAPMLERERSLRELSSIHVGDGGLGELPRLLDAIAEKAGFASVVLSDESGLPLAASADAGDVDGLAGIAAFFLTLGERAERAALPRPLSCLVLDETNRMTLHRMFVVGAARYTVTAVSRGMALAPGALDPALSPLERALTKRERS